MEGKGIGKRLGLNGLFVVISLLALYGLSCTLVKSWQIYTDDFFGVIELGLCSLAISALWLFLYWFLDRVQHESLQMTLLAFALGLASYLANKGIVDWITGKSSSVFMENIGLPVISFFIVFTFIVLKLPAFDELVDSFIYGGFVGTGIAFATCMTSFVHYPSLDGQFVIITLITRISVHSAICSLAGFIIHQILLKKKSYLLLIPIVLLIFLFSVDYFVNQIFSKSVKLSGIEILPVLISIIFALVIVAVVVVLVRFTLKRDIAGEKASSVFYDKGSILIALVLALLFIIQAFCVRYNELGTIRFISPDGNWTFDLPKKFSEVKETKSESIFNFEEETGEVFYKNEFGSINLYIYYDAKKAIEDLYVSYKIEDNVRKVNGWDVSVSSNSFLAEDSYSNPYMLYQKSYYLKKGNKEVLIDTFSDKEDDEEAKKAARTLIRTLEAKNE